jgi:hypothetical protein
MPASGGVNNRQPTSSRTRARSRVLRSDIGRFKLGDSLFMLSGSPQVPDQMLRAKLPCQTGKTNAIRPILTATARIITRHTGLPLPVSQSAGRQPDACSFVAGRCDRTNPQAQMQSPDPGHIPSAVHPGHSIRTCRSDNAVPARNR